MSGTIARSQMNLVLGEWVCIQFQASKIMVSSFGFSGSHPRSDLILSLEATSTDGSPGRLGDSTASMGRPVTLRAAPTISKTEKPSPLPRL
jgi:hypothetical protein